MEKPKTKAKKSSKRGSAPSALPVPPGAAQELAALDELDGRTQSAPDDSAPTASQDSDMWPPDVFDHPVTLSEPDPVDPSEADFSVVELDAPAFEDPEPITEPMPVCQPALDPIEPTKEVSPEPAPEPRVRQTHMRGVYVGAIIETVEDLIEHSYPHLMKK